MEEEKEGGWKKLQRNDYRLSAYKPEIEMQTGSEMRVPAAFVHPFPIGNNSMMEKENLLSSFIHRPQHDSRNLPSYLTSLQTPLPSTPASRLVKRSPPYVTVSFDRVLHYSSNNHELELKSLQYEVQEIKNKINVDVIGSSEYQQLLSEKLKLEERLGSTEYMLQQLRMAYNDVNENATASEQEFSQKLSILQENYQHLGERHNATSDQLNKLKDYLRDLPTLNEHQQLQQEIAQKSAQISHLTNKVEHCSQHVKNLTRKEKEQADIIESLTQERDDISLKLNLAENILKELESQRAAACEEGQHSKEDLLWKLDQTNKELESAKKLLNYRKQKLKELHKEFMEQDKKYTDKLQTEKEQGEELKEIIKQLETNLEEYKFMEEKMKSKLTSMEQKQKKTEESLKMTLEQAALQSDMFSIVKSLSSCLHTAVQKLKDLMKVSEQISQGHSPDPSLLLGISESSDDDECESVTLEALKPRLTELHDLTKELEDIRTLLQEQYAHQLAKDLSCAQM